MPTNSAQGIDVSNYQGQYDWTAAKDLSFGIVLATDGLGFVDGNLRWDWDQMRAKGLVRGAYHYFDPFADAAEQARRFVSVLEAIDLSDRDMLWLDHEHPGQGKPYPPPGKAAAAARAFMEELTRLRPRNPRGVYTTISMGQEGYCEGLGDYPLWLAHPGSEWPSAPPPWHGFSAFWQWGTGRRDRSEKVPTDLDAFNGSPQDLERWISAHAIGSPPPLPQQPPSHQPPSPQQPSPSRQSPPERQPSQSGIPAWQEEIMNRFPTLKEGQVDVPDAVKWVHRVQALCNAEGVSCRIDGVFGPTTTEAVRRVQQLHRVPVDGVVGPGTWSVLATGAPLQSATAEPARPGAPAPSRPDGQGTPAPSRPAGVSDQVWQWMQEAIRILEQDNIPASKLDPKAIATIIQHESSGDPNAVNHWDSNAKAGDPSQGLMQITGANFRKFSLPGHGDILNPVDNIVASCRYAIANYGSLDRVPGVEATGQGATYTPY